MTEIITPIKGYCITLDDKRSVFAGRVEGDGRFYVNFMNGENVGDESTKLILSTEAMNALIDIVAVLSGDAGRPLANGEAAIETIVRTETHQWVVFQPEDPQHV
ncbi:hypothetical protein [Hyphomicrobium sp.]|uniref:hypothetical protein n=1 Tax=Hyphomicrobium sp. TaxID=82 RepID=UPI001DEA8795|nr:hypothetical protein [Hyphomicrobium sp.]MBY0559909.1 hypothetical protein [Hyphomicrobium sp.]